MNLAPGVEFNEEKHEYYYRGRKLSGVTGLISKRLGLRMPAEFVEEHRLEGVHIHQAIQKWIDTGDPGSVHPGVRWIMESWDDSPAIATNSEVLVSDRKQYASSVDILVERKDGLLDIYDIKKGVFRRDYATWQLSIYKYFIEQFAERKVNRCCCVCVRDKQYYDVYPKAFDQVEELLYGKLLHSKKHEQ
jgi:hypothetical protein